MSRGPIVVRRDEGTDFDLGDPSHIRVRITGSLIVVPPGVPHGLAPSGHWRHLTLVLPGGFDRYFNEVAAMLAAGGGTQERSAIAARYGTYPAAPGQQATQT